MDATTGLESALSRRWNDLTSSLTPSVKEKWWKRLMCNYRERTFHNLEHLNEMFLLFDEFKDNLRQQFATAFAIFFLHAEYDPKRSDNAERNAELLKQFAAEAKLEMDSYATSLILESAKHCTDAHLSADKYGNDDIHFLLDFDMAFLGSSCSDYNRHSKNIRCEFTHLNDDEYRQQRLKVLKLFMQIPNIYATKELRDRLEAQARQNITNEIAELSK